MPGGWGAFRHWIMCEAWFLPGSRRRSKLRAPCGAPFLSGRDQRQVRTIRLDSQCGGTLKRIAAKEAHQPSRHGDVRYLLPGYAVPITRVCSAANALARWIISAGRSRGCDAGRHVVVGGQRADVRAAGGWNSDARLCLLVPSPCTTGRIVIGMETKERS